MTDTLSCVFIVTTKSYIHTTVIPKCSNKSHEIVYYTIMLHADIYVFIKHNRRQLLFTSHTLTTCFSSKCHHLPDVSSILHLLDTGDTSMTTAAITET